MIFGKINDWLKRIASASHSCVPSMTGIIPKSFINQFIPDNSIIVEGGANRGYDTIEMSILLPNATIHAFEPVPELFAQLEKNTGQYKNIICYPVALSDVTGKMKMYISEGGGNDSSSLLKPREHLIDHPAIAFKTALEVPTITLDDWAQNNEIKKVDFLWLDIQGYEFAVLKASPALLANVAAIYTEVSLKETYEGVLLYPEFRQWLISRGFMVKREELPWHDMGNVLFVRQPPGKA
ncbi:MAG: FkbM family methyltransferase [Candidatus Omnitrophota bacterium]